MKQPYYEFHFLALFQLDPHGGDGDDEADEDEEDEPDEEEEVDVRGEGLDEEEEEEEEQEIPDFVAASSAEIMQQQQPLGLQFASQARISTFSHSGEKQGNRGFRKFSGLLNGKLG